MRWLPSDNQSRIRILLEHPNIKWYKIAHTFLQQDCHLPIYRAQYQHSLAFYLYNVSKYSGFNTNISTKSNDLSTWLRIISKLWWTLQKGMVEVGSLFLFNVLLAPSWSMALLHILIRTCFENDQNQSQTQNSAWIAPEHVCSDYFDCSAEGIESENHFSHFWGSATSSAALLHKIVYAKVQWMIIFA